MKKIICLCFLAPFMIGFTNSQNIKNSIWQITNASIPYPKGDYWNFVFEKDTALYHIVFPRNYKYDLVNKSIKIPNINKKCSLELDEDIMKIKCGQNDFVGKKLNQADISELHFLNISDCYITLPKMDNCGPCIIGKDFEYNSDDNLKLYISPYLKSSSKELEEVSHTYVQVHFDKELFRLCELKEFCNLDGLHITTNNYILKEKIVHQGKINASTVIVYIDKNLSIEDLDVLFENLQSCTSIKKVYLAINIGDNKTFNPGYKEFTLHYKLDYRNSENYEEWIKEDSPIIEGQTMKKNCDKKKQRSIEFNRVEK